ncbi:MAG: CapA family protein [Bacteroidales bacterium]|nr:CapA family protein [Bacteroidales bacterium]
MKKHLYLLMLLTVLPGTFPAYSQALDSKFAERAPYDAYRSFSPPDTIRLTFIGDVMGHMPQITHGLKSGAPADDPASYDFSSWFRYVKCYFDRADISVANMEFTCGVTPYTGYPTFSSPASIAWETAVSGVDVFLTANNHICDKGLKGLDSTFAIYRRMDIPFAGSYSDPADELARNPLILEVKGVKFAFINLTYGLNGFTCPKPYTVNQLDTTLIRKLVGRARASEADFVIALPHWGEEYQLDYNKVQKKWADFMYEAGVDMIVGSHPHVVQKADYSDGRLTIYSLGNFISNMSVDYSQIGMLATVTIVVGKRRNIEMLEPEIEYLWCCKWGTFEDNYTVIPIRRWENEPDAFRNRAQYDKMMREWRALKAKFKLDD